MNKNEHLGPIAVIFLTVAFALISLAVFLSRGKSAYWISKKMKIGALLLSLTAATIQQSCIGSTCYDPLPPNEFSVENRNINGEIELNLNVNNKVNGVIYGRMGVEFSFNIADTTSLDVVQRGTISALDGSFDSETENFVVELNDTLKTGNYLLNLYSSSVSAQDTANPNDFFRLRILNED